MSQARDGEIEGRVEPRCIPGLRHALYITVLGYIHWHVNLALEGNVCNNEIFRYYCLGFAERVGGTIDIKIIIYVTTFS